MILWLYRLLLWLLFPVVLYSAWKRCRKVQDPETEIRDCVRARYGLNRQTFASGGIWVHAVSVGETRSIFPLLKRLQQRYPDWPITLTSGSTQGALQALKFAPVPIQHQMIPYDYPFAIRRFLKQIQPKLVIMVETEIWPNLYQICHEQNIPLILANARLKQKSFQAYRKWGGSLLTRALNQTQLIGAQFEQDRENFIALGAKPEKVQVLGNLKFDIDIPAQLTQQAEQWRQTQQAQSRFIWVAASTHQHEEALMLQAHAQLLQAQPDALLILVPRHADRFQQVENELKNSTLRFSQRSKQQPLTPNSQVYYADTIGELMLWFAVADVAFIGGSLVNFGGHNILEPAALAKPVISGPHYQNLHSLYMSFIKEQAITLSPDTQALAQSLIEFSQNPDHAQAMGQKAQQSFKKQTGALSNTLAKIESVL